MQDVGRPWGSGARCRAVGGSGHRSGGCRARGRRRGGEGGEDQRVVRDRLGDGLATGDPGADLEGVSGVQAGAGLAPVGPPVAASGERHAQGLVRRAVGADHFPGGGVDGLRAADQPDRVGAEPEARQDLGPVVEVPREQRVTSWRSVVSSRSRSSGRSSPNRTGGSASQTWLRVASDIGATPFPKGVPCDQCDPAARHTRYLGGPLRMQLTDAWGSLKRRTRQINGADEKKCLWCV